VWRVSILVLLPFGRQRTIAVGSSGVQPVIDLTDLRTRATECTRCPASRFRFQVVLYRGSSNPELLFVGQSPGREEDKLGVPFIGPSGQMLTEALAARPSLPPWGIINVMNCRPPDDVYREDYGDKCLPFLVEKLRLFHPKWVVAVGKDAATMLWQAEQRNPGVLPGRPVQLIHPSAVLRHRTWQPRWEDGWKKVEEAVHANGSR
jgi:uracil-DNA glycosylase